MGLFHLGIDDSAKGGVTQFCELFAVIPLRAQNVQILVASLFEDIFASDYIEGLFKGIGSYLVIFGSRHYGTAKLGSQRITVKIPR